MGAASAFAVLVCVGACVAHLLSGPNDGMTRAERAAFESTFRSELVGAWDAAGAL